MMLCGSRGFWAIGVLDVLEVAQVFNSPSATPFESHAFSDCPDALPVRVRYIPGELVGADSGPDGIRTEVDGIAHQVLTARRPRDTLREICRMFSRSPERVHNAHCDTSLD